jgi:hypothetical protein
MRRAFEVAWGLTAWACSSGGDSDPSAATAGAAGSGAGIADGPAYVQDCYTLCDAMIARGCDDEACGPSCVSANESAGSCSAALGEYVQCLADHVSDIPSCYDYPGACEEAYFGWASCVSEQTGTCGPLKCDEVPTGSCSCWAICDAQTVRESCEQHGDGSKSCTCLVDDRVVATCDSSPASCAFFAGCCSGFL